MKGKAMLLNDLKNFDTDGGDVDELVALLTFGNQMSQTYTSKSLEVPGWLSDKLGAIAAEIDYRHKDALVKEYKETKNRLESLKTNEEKRADLTAKLERLKTAIG
jgi:hypothetical protein